MKENIFFILKCVAILVTIWAMSSFAFACTLYFEKNSILDIRYCPECGHDFLR